MDPVKYIDTIGELEDDDIDLAIAALGLATMASRPMEYYLNHLQSLRTATSEYYSSLTGSLTGTDAIGSTNTANIHKQLHCLQAVVFGEFDYCGNQENYDELENADLCAVIDRRKGMPIALSILCIHIARSLGWDCAGIAMPGHFICRLHGSGERLVFDPFNKAKILEAPDLRQLVKQAMGPEAELKPEYYDVVSNSMILLRLQNNIKLRQLQANHYEQALDTLASMQKISPEETGFLFERGQILARINQPMAAIDCLKQYIEKAPAHYDRSQATLLLQKLNKQLN